MTMATSSEGGALAIVTTTATSAGHGAAEAIDRRAASASPDDRSRSQWRTIPPWLMVKDTNTPTEYSGISAVGVALEDDEEDDRDEAEDHDPRRERQAVTAEAELAWQVSVLGEDRGQSREGVVARVRGEEEDERREGLEQVEPDASRRRTPAPPLG